MLHKKQTTLISILNIRKDERILVTGGTGVLGNYIVKNLLARGYSNIEVFTRSGGNDNLQYADDSRIVFTKGDVSQLFPLSDSIDKADYVIHAAAVVSFDPKFFKKMHLVNVEGTANVVNLAAESNVKKLVHVSSIAALGRNERSGTISESTKWVNSKYNSYYGITKYLAEQEVWRSYYEGLPTVIINPSLIIGEGEWGQSSLQLFDKVYDGLPFYPNGGTGIVDVRDVAEFAVRLMESSIEGERYILSAANISYKDLFSKIAAAMNRKAPTKLAPRWMLSIFWRLEKLRSWIAGSSPVITRESVKSTAHLSQYDNSKSLEIEGFTYENIEHTIQKYTQMYIESKKGSL